MLVAGGRSPLDDNDADVVKTTRKLFSGKDLPCRLAIFTLGLLTRICLNNVFDNLLK